MRIRFDYRGAEGEPFEVPDARRLGVFEPAPPPARSGAATAADALADPIEAEPLHDLARGAHSVLVLVDDATRHTPTASFLPAVARELEQAGVQDRNVVVVTAQGSHRPLTADEVETKLGPFAKRWRVEPHDWSDPRGLRDLGATPDGMPIVVNRRVADADLVVGIGGVMVHGLMGFSGGAKIVFPGVGGRAQVSWTHWNATRFRTEALLGMPDNPLRLNIEAAAAKAGLDAVLNAVLDPDREPCLVAYGDFVHAQRACARHCASVSAVRIPRRADVVVVDPFPAERDFWQTIKGLYAASLVVKDAGVTVLVAPNPEGVAANHPNMLELAGLPFGEVRQRVEAGAVDDVLGAAVAGITAQVRERSDVLLVSSGIDEPEAAALGFVKMATPQRALDEALRRAPRDAEVAVLRHAGDLLPIVPGNPQAALATGPRDAEEAGAPG